VGRKEGRKERESKRLGRPPNGGMCIFTFLFYFYKGMSGESIVNVNEVISLWMLLLCECVCV